MGGVVRPRLAVFVNASARRSSGDRWRAALRLLEARAEVQVCLPPSAEALTREVRLAAEAGVDGVVVVGGDGTVNAAANGLVGLRTPLGIIPRGTGNDFARVVGVPAEPASAAHRVLAGRTTTVDLVEVGGRHFCTAGILGVPAAAALTVRGWFSPGKATRPLLHLIGGGAYTLAGLRHLLSPALRPRDYRITCDDGRSLDIEAYGVFAANTPALGGGLVLPVGSDGSDGVMELVAIHAVPRWRLLMAFVCFARGWRLPGGTLTTWSARTATIDCAGDEAFAADGDLLGCGSAFRLEVKPGALRVFV